MQVQPQYTTNLHITWWYDSNKQQIYENHKDLAVNNSKPTKQQVVNTMTSSSVADYTLFYAKPTSPYH